MAVAEPTFIYKDSPQYENARIGRVFNHRRPDRYPVAVVEAESVDDIVKAVKHAKQLGTRVSVRSGGHSWAAWSVRDDAVLIDLGKLNFIELDEVTGIAKVSPSTTGRILNGYLITKGRMFGGGHCPDVGLGGFLLQGGMGWNCRNWGWACEQIVALDVVTAEGELLHVDKDQNSDLLWAAKGAGPGFPAIVVAFYLQTRKSFSKMKASTFLYPLSEYKRVMDWTVKISAESDDSIEAVGVGIIDQSTGKPAITAHFVTFQNTDEAAHASLKLINDTHPPGAYVEKINQPTSLEKEYCDQADANPDAHRYVCDNAYISNDADVTAVLEKAFTTLPEGSKAFSLWYSMYPCSRRQLPPMAVSMQSDHYFALYTVWEHEKDDDRCKAWVKDIMKGVERHSDGAYLGDSDFQTRRTRFWGQDEGKKLNEVRRTWDPTGRICGYLDIGDASRVKGLENVHEWQRDL